MICLAGVAPLLSYSSYSLIPPTPSKVGDMLAGVFPECVSGTGPKKREALTLAVFINERSYFNRILQHYNKCLTQLKPTPTPDRNPSPALS